MLAENGIDRQIGHTAGARSLLAGLIHDGVGNRMAPTHVVKGGGRFRYYVSRPLITEGRSKASAARRLPAAEVEQAVTDRIRVFLADAAAVFDAMGTAVTETAEQKRLVERAAELARQWPTLLPARLRSILCVLVRRIKVGDAALNLHLVPSRLPIILHTDRTDRAELLPVAAGEEMVLVAAVRLARIGPGTKLIMEAAGTPGAKPNPNMVRLVAQAHQVQQRLLQGRHASIKEFAEQEQMTGSYLARLIRLAWLAPDITQAILTGQQPPALSAVHLMQGGPLPIDWQEQRRVLGFG